MMAGSLACVLHACALSVPRGLNRAGFSRYGRFRNSAGPLVAASASPVTATAVPLQAKTPEVDCGMG
jgi:hypothetical protein